MLIINVYNPGGNELIDNLKQYLRSQLRTDRYDEIIIGGDFNLHHPLWNPVSYHRHDRKVDELIKIMAESGLNILLPANTITYPSAGTTIDLIWGNEKVAEAIEKCQIAQNNDHASDHLPIELSLHLQPPTIIPTQPPFNYTKTDWKRLETILPEYLPPLLQNTQNPRTAAIDKFAEDITTAITKAVTETTPRKKPCPFSKRWWNDDLTDMRRRTNHLRNVYRRMRLETVRTEWNKQKEIYRH